MICSKCGGDKTPDQFNDDQHGNKRKDCKVCQSAYNALYYANNRAKVLQYQDNYRLENNEQITKTRKQKAKMKKTITSIVQTPKGTFYSMQNSDERFNTDNYKQVAEIASVETAQTSTLNGRKCRVVTLKNGQQFEVFTDWSARERKDG